jgi:hypothetical protein
LRRDILDLSIYLLHLSSTLWSSSRHDIFATQYPGHFHPCNSTVILEGYFLHQFTLFAFSRVRGQQRSRTTTMTSPKSKGSRKLSAAFDNFRNKCRKTRIDSLLSPPSKPEADVDGGDKGSSASSSSGGTSGLDDEGLKLISDDDGGMDSKFDSKDSVVAKQRSTFVLDDNEAEDEESVTSADENNRLLTALADFTAEPTDTEDFEHYFRFSDSLSCFDTTAATTAITSQVGVDEERISPGARSGRVLDTALPLPHVLPTGASGSTLSFEIGVPLQRSGFPHGYVQVQQAREQQQDTCIWQDEAVYTDTDTGIMTEAENQKKQQRGARKTVDGVKMDARPLLRHTGISAPPHSSLRVHTALNDETEHLLQRHWTGGSSSSFDMSTTTAAAAVSKTSSRHLRPVSSFSWSSDSSASTTTLTTTTTTTGERYGRQFTDSRANSIAQQPENDINLSAFSSATTAPRLHRTSHTSSLHTHYNNSTSLPTKATTATTTCLSAPLQQQEQKLHFGYSHTPPIPPLNPRRFHQNQYRRPPLSTYTALLTSTQISLFHAHLTSLLTNAISTGRIPASQIPVRERVRRLSGVSARVVRQGGVKVGEWARGFGEGIIAGGGVGVGWGEVVGSAAGDENSDVGRRSGLVYYGGGFV